MQPTYEKQHTQPQLDYHMMTWETFLTIREWAQEVANVEGYPLYLVGSALWKSYPRDIDISMIIPIKDFEERFGKIPDTEDELKEYLNQKEYYQSWGIYQFHIQERIRWINRIDLKFQPDVWFKEKDKMLLVEPNGKARVRGWEEIKKREI